MRRFITGLFCIVFLSVKAPATPAVELVEFFSFEQDFEGWMPEHLPFFESQGNWSITRSQDMARSGVTSLKFFSQGTFDIAAGPSWIVRPFSLVAGKTYQVRVTFYLATQYSQDIVPGAAIMAAALSKPPVTFDDLAPFVEDFTLNERAFGSRYRWVRKQYEFTAQPDASGQIYVIVGIRDFCCVQTYYIDNVRLVFTRRHPAAVGPVVDSAARIGRKVVIQGTGFGPSPRVLINNIDRTDFVMISSPDFIRLKGTFFALGFRVGDNTIRVVDDTTAAASAPFDLKVTD